MSDVVPVRRATASDAEALVTLAERTFRDAFAGDNEASDMDAYARDAFSVGRIRDELANPANSFFLAAPPERPPMGYAKLRVGPVPADVTGPKPIELQRIYVAQEAIGRGVGAVLMRTCIEAARDNGHQTLWLGVWERNERAIGFYERWGFEVLGAKAFRLGSDDQTDLVLARPV